MTEGCIIEYSYFNQFHPVVRAGGLVFSKGNPRAAQRAQVVYPARLEYTYFFQGNEGMKRVKDEKDLTILEGSNGRFTVKPGIYIFENAPAMKGESYITTMNDYRRGYVFSCQKSFI